jgi:hypothetical protein
VRIDGSLQEQWDAVLEAVRGRSRVTHVHLREGWPIEAASDKLVVGFEKEFHAHELLKRPDHVQRITEVLEQIFGRKLQLDAQVRPGERPGAGNGSSDAPEHDAVDLVKRGLGAEVVGEVSTS